MIATRLAAVWQVALVAGMALGCYLLSSVVAAQRAGLAQVDRQIGRERDAIAKLETEIATRSRLTQIESWNRQLALQAPRPAQYVQNGVQLASLYARDDRPQLRLDPTIATHQGPIQQAAFAPAPADVAPPPVVLAVAKSAPVRRQAPVIVRVAATEEPAPQPLLRAATFVKPRVDRLAGGDIAPVVKAALRQPAALLPSDIGRLAAAETQGKDGERRPRR